MIRDGGSLAATFAIGGDRKFILLIQIAETMSVWHAPVLMDPDKRADPVPVPWAEARRVLTELSALARGLSAVAAEWLRQMIEVAASDGRPPGGLKDHQEGLKARPSPLPLSPLTQGEGER